MNSFNDNSLENIFQNKKDLSMKKRLYNEKKIAFEITKGSQDSIKIKEKSNVNELNFKKIKKIKDIMPKSNKSFKETLSYQNSHFPICISFMTNTKNYLNSIDNKFKIGNNSNKIEQKPTEDNSRLNNNSFINNNNDKSALNKNYKKIDLKLNFDKSKNFKNELSNQDFNSIKYNQSRNIKFKLFDFIDNKSLNIKNKNYNNFLESFDKSSFNIYNPKKIIKQKQKQKESKNNVESDEELRNKINVINKFVSLKLSKNKLKNILQEKNKSAKEASFDQKEISKNDKSDSVKSIKILKKIKKDNIDANSKNTSLLMPKIITNNPNISKHMSKTINVENINKEDKLLLQLKQRELKKKIKEKSEKNELIKIKENKMVPASVEKKEENKNNEIRKTKRKKTKEKKFKKMISKKFMIGKTIKKNKIKISNIIPENVILKDNINNDNFIFLNEIKIDNDTKQENKKLDKKIKSNKISKILIQKSNLDKIISKQKEKLKAYSFSFNLNKQLGLEIESIKVMNKIKIKGYVKTFLELKKYSILFILLYSYIKGINKCALDYNMLNYIRLNVEFSSIYLPIVKLGEEKSILITDKLFSFKNYKPSNNILQMAKTKFVETKKYQKGVQSIALNFITKELLYYNIHAEEINFLEDLNSENNNDTESSKIRKLSCSTKKLPITHSVFSNKKKGPLHKNTIFKRMLPTVSLSLLEKKKFFDSPKKRLERKLRYSLNNNLSLYKISGNNSISNLLINNNDRLNIKDRLNQQYLHRTMSLIHEQKIKRENRALDYFELLRKITGKANIEVILRAFIQEGETALFTEYFNNNYRRIDMNVKDNDGNTFLILSVKQGLDIIAKTLLEKGVDVNIQNNEGNSALHYALSSKNFTIADLLKKFGAKEDCYNTIGYTPWDCVGKSIDIINE